jgi:hypothetical protein
MVPVFFWASNRSSIQKQASMWPVVALFVSRRAAQALRRAETEGGRAFPRCCSVWGEFPLCNGFLSGNRYSIGSRKMQHGYNIP